MARSTQELLVVIDASVESLRRELARADDSVARSTNKIDRALNRVDQSFHSINESARRTASVLQATMAAVAGSVVIRSLVTAADTYTRIEGQLRLVTKSSAELADIQEKLFQSAQRTSSAFADTVTLYARLAQNTQELGISQSQLLALTEEINQSFVISGASITEASAATLQLTQAFASGVLRGEEFNSLMENSPRLARALADALGTTVGGLRKMAEAGELTTDRVLPALLSKAGEIQEEFRSMGGTVEQAMTRLTNAVDRAMGRTDMSPLVGAIDRLTEVVSDPEVQRGVQSLATTAVNFVSDMSEGLAALGRAISDLRNLDFAGASKALGRQLLDNSGPGFVYEMLTGKKWSDRLDEVLSGQSGAQTPVTLPAVKAIAPLLPSPASASTIDPQRVFADFEFSQFEKAPATGLDGALEASLPKANGSLQTLIDKAKEMDEQFGKANETASLLRDTADEVGFGFASAFTDAIFGAKSFGDALNALADSLAKTITQMLILKSIEMGINSLFPSGKATASAKGNVFNQSGIVPFANGGIVNNPTLFKFANGTGLMGEAGPEAIMPLARGRGGKLGVQASGGGVVVNINNHSQAQVTTNTRRGPDGQQVLDLMIEDSFNRLLGSGRLDASLAANTGIRRPGRF